MTNIEHDVVKKSLFQFINAHIPNADLSVVDEIVLSYVVSILEEASEDPHFDVEGFTEMMSAYFEEFSSIDPAEVCTWIFQLENQLSNMKNKAASNGAHNLSLDSLSLVDMIPKDKLIDKRTASISEDSAPNQTAHPHPKRVQHLSETSDCGSTDSSNCDLYIDECDALQEMFPESSLIEVKHCILIANGDLDRATQILIHRQEAGQSFISTNMQTANKVHTHVDENELKNRIISRYSYVDKEDHREYKPVAPKVEPKKLIRYRDNKVVSLKGERYTEVSRRGDDETELKKPKKPILP